MTDDREIAAQEVRAERRADARREGEPVSDRDYDRLKAGPWWNYAPGMEPRSDW